MNKSIAPHSAIEVDHAIEHKNRAMNVLGANNSRRIWEDVFGSRRIWEGARRIKTWKILK